MAEEIALYNKYRPRFLKDVVGQDHVKKTLENSAKQNKIGHAYLFTGVMGCGKTSIARILACIVNCENGPSVDYDIENGICKSIINQSCPDIQELDAASQKTIEDMREIRKTALQSPMYCNKRVIIIDECLPEDALILLPDGSKKTILEIIENNDIDAVLSYNFDTMKLETKKIVRKIKNTNNKNMKLLKLKDKEGNIRILKITENHNVFLNSLEKIKVSQLKTGDKLNIISK